MSEFERIDQDSAWANAGELKFPADFTKEEAAFARKMREIFVIEGEDLPPLYAQTLLDPEKYEIPNRGFEQRVTAEVLERLHLSGKSRPESSSREPEAPLPPVRESATRRLRISLHGMRQFLNRPMTLAASLALLVLAVSLVVASPTFARGLQVIFGNTGVAQVESVPTHVSPTKRQKNSGPAAPAVTFPNISLFWPGPVANNYAYEGTHLQVPTKWSTGAIVDMQYSLPSDSQGSGMLDIREFQVASSYSAVLQVVEDGNTTSLTLADGSPAVYVNGMWVPRMLDHTQTYVWQTGTHCLLIMEREGVVIWMVGDPRDGLTAQTMAALANQMVPVNRATLLRNYRGVWLASASLVVSVNNTSGSECYLLVPQGISPASGVGDFVFSGSGANVGGSSTSTGPTAGP